MAVVEVKPLFTWLEPNSDGQRVYRQTWSVLVDDKDDSIITVGAATGLPSAGDYWTWGNDSDLYAYADPIPGIKLEKQDQSHRKLYHVTYTFTTEPRRRCNTTDIALPTAEPWTFSGTGDEWQEKVGIANDEDGNGPVAITNSSLEPFEVAVTRTKRRLTLGKNYTSINQTWIELYGNSVNSAAITIFGKTYQPRCLFMRSITFSRARYGVCTYYYPCQFDVDVNYSTFDIQFPDKGFRQVKASVTDPTDPVNHYNWIVDDDDVRVRDPIYLDGAGSVLAATGAGTGGTGGQITPVMRRYRVYDELDWSIFNFPTTA